MAAIIPCTYGLIQIAIPAFATVLFVIAGFGVLLLRRTAS